MKSIITTDTHLGRSNNDKFAIDTTIKFFEWVADVSKQREVENFLHLGDFFHSRKSILIPTISAGIEIYDILSNMFQMSYILLGNHDCYYKDTASPSSLDMFKYFDTGPKNVKIVDNIETVSNMLLIPWMFSEEQTEEIVKNAYDVPYALGHLPINEITLNRSGKKSDKELFNISDFDRYDKVFSGHFHQPGIYNNITYLGAPFHMNFNDSGNRGIYIFDDETGEIEFIEYNGAPKFCIIDGENYDKDCIEGNNIRLEFHNNIGLNKIDEVISDVESLNPHSLNVSYKFSVEFTENNQGDIIDEIKGNKDILIDYIRNSKVPDHLSLSTIESIIDNLEKE